MRSSFICLLVLSVIVTELPAQAPLPESTTQQPFNQVFVKVIVPVTSRTPKQDGPVVEHWVAKQLKQLGESEFFAVTNWVPVCDALLEDDTVDNDVWDGRLEGFHGYCPVGGDIPQRENGRVSVSVAGWTPVGGEANITLSDQAGNRAVGPVRLQIGEKGKRTEIEKGLPYVAVIIAPPPWKRDTPRSDAD